jgi:ubiquinone/menaquinone biosynthesis C-methylase UbiE
MIESSKCLRVFAVAAIACAVSTIGLSAGGQSTQKRRLFQTVDLGLLEAPDRDEWQKPDQIMDTLRIAEGSVVAEIGAAGGWFTMHLARRVGPNGAVYAEDIQREMVEGIARRSQREKVPWVTPILGTATDPRLPGGLDAILVADVYHEVDDPVALLKNAARSLKPQGLLGVVDFLPGGGGPGPAPDERPDPNAVTQAAEAAGLQLSKREDIPPFVFLLVFERATRPTPAQ